MKQKLKIKKYPNDDKVLRKVSCDIKSVTKKEIELFNDMALIMKKNEGVGIAAPQVGICLNMIVVDIGDGLVKLANPKIIKKSDDQDFMEEGCLSVPDITVNVSRPIEIIVQGLNEENNKIKINCKGLMARVIQHEIDHLLGKLIVDYKNIFNNFN